MSWLLIMLIAWAAVAALGALWLGGAARLVAQEGVRPAHGPDVQGERVFASR